VYLHKQPDYWLFSNKNCICPFSFCRAAAKSAKTDFDPLLLPSFLIQVQNKGKGAPAIQRQAGLVSSFLFLL